MITIKIVITFTIALSELNVQIAPIKFDGSWIADSSLGIANILKCIKGGKGVKLRKNQVKNMAEK